MLGGVILNYQASHRLLLMGVDSPYLLRETEAARDKIGIHKAELPFTWPMLQGE